ncbi:hypothetical protein SDC9_78155 [bioreactor metagenome]|uniref:Uncharacterized protein n=1 Tax=bioreactor metagenome TaxID=1076179 RepID=A0A644YTF6_9ZZZZ
MINIDDRRTVAVDRRSGSIGSRVEIGLIARVEIIGGKLGSVRRNCRAGRSSFDHGFFKRVV